MYKFINILYSDAQCSQFARTLVDLQKVNRQQKTTFKQNNDQRMTLMNQYHDGDLVNNAISANHLLIQASYLITSSHVFSSNSDHEDDLDPLRFIVLYKLYYKFINCIIGICIIYLFILYIYLFVLYLFFNYIFTYF